MITEILYFIFFTVTVTLAWKILISPGMLLEKIGNRAQYEIEQGNKVFDLIFCEWCAVTTFIWVGWVFMFSFEVVPFTFKLNYIALHFIVWFCSSFVSGITWTFYTTTNAKKEYYESAKKYYDNAEQISFWEIKERKESHYKKKHNVNNGIKDY